MAADHTSARLLAAPELNAAKALMLTILRLWFSNKDNAVYPLARWQDGFAAAGIDTLAQHSFDTLLRIVTDSSLSPLQVQQPGTHLLSQDEVRFLHMLNLLQNMHHNDACKLLGDWLNPPSAQNALFSAIRVADALDRAGLKMETATHQSGVRVSIDSSTRVH